MNYLQKFESYKDDKEYLLDIFGQFEEDYNVQVSVEKSTLPYTYTLQHIPVSFSFYSLFSDLQFPFHVNVSKLLPDSEIINIRRKRETAPYRGIQFYFVRIDLDENLYLNIDPRNMSDLCEEHGFLQIYDSMGKIKRGGKIYRFLVFYHESEII